jgi:hypothetical protein
MCAIREGRCGMDGRVYCADVTKLVAADSLLRMYSLSDPEAESAFCDLTTVLCNPCDLYFFRRAHLPADHLGPVAKCWLAIASSDATPGVPAGRPPSNPIVMNGEYANFFTMIFKGPDAMRAVEWVCFQSSIPKLMRVFWSTNDEEDLELSYRAFADPSLTLMDLRAKIQGLPDRLPLHIVRASNRALAELGYPLLNARWTDETLTIAYLAWHFIKGFRYVNSLDSQHTYAVHFTRQHVFDPRLPWARHQTTSPMRRGFPWGNLLLAMNAQTARLGEDYSEVIASLRAFTRAESPRL